MTNKTKVAIEEAAKRHVDEMKWSNEDDSLLLNVAEKAVYNALQEAIDHLERYGLMPITSTEKQELYDILCATAAHVRYYADKDKELHGVIQELIKKFKP